MSEWTLFKRGEYWYARRNKKTASGKWGGKDMISLKTTNAIVAKRKLKSMGAGDQDVLIEDVYETFKTEIENQDLDSKTSYKYLQHLRVFIAFIERKVGKIKDVKKEHIFDFLKCLVDQGLSKSTLSGYKRTLKKLFIIFEKEENVLIKNPMRFISPGKMETRLNLFSQDEIRNILAAASGNDYDMALVLYFFQTGLRIQGVVDSSWDNLNLDRHTLKVIVKRKKKIIIPIPDRAFNAVSKIKKGDKLFNTNRQKTIYADIKRILSIAKVAGSPHDFRRTYASYSLAIGIPLPVVRDRLGHDNIAQTDKYSHAINCRIDDDIRELFNDWQIKN